MRVLIDDQMFAMQKRGGITRYFTQLMTEFTRMPDIDLVTPYRYVVNEHVMEAFPRRFRRFPKPHRAPSRRVLEVVNRGYRRKAPPVDIVHNTYYWPELLEENREAKRVCTVHDMIPELFPDYFPRGNPHREKRQFVEKCDMVLCVSENTKDDLLRIYGPLDKPVVVTYPGVDASFSAPVRTSSPIASPYVLFVGSRRGYKNFAVVARAVAALMPRFPELRLICVGGGKFGVSEVALLRGLGIDRVTERHAPSDAQLSSFYAHATALCFPSRYEGFGLPVVEAFAARCPVLISPTPCLVEIADGAAQVIDADAAEEWAEALGRLLSDDSSRAGWIARGSFRAADFTWRSTAERTIDAYELALE